MQSTLWVCERERDAYLAWLFVWESFLQPFFIFFFYIFFPFVHFDEMLSSLFKIYAQLRNLERKKEPGSLNKEVDVCWDFFSTKVFE